MNNGMVEIFIELWKEACKNGIDFVPRSKNREFLSMYKLTKNQAIEALRNLSAEHYCSGPEKDKDRKGDVWKFKINMHDIKDIYVKVKLYSINGKYYAKCISFHK